ncbi:MAG: hypothetical protein ACT4TC_01045 [Myxococcaceae bacterium]
MVRALLVLLCATAFPALGQDSFNGDYRGAGLLLSEGTLRGSPRLMGLAGAYVGIAEGAEGMTRNPAAVANRDPHFEGDWSFDLGGTLHFLFPWSVREQDWDNDGRPDQLDNGGPLRFLGTQVLYSTLKVQYKNVALGIGGDVQNFLYQRVELGETVPSKAFSLALIHLFATLGVTFWEDQIVLGAGIESTHALIALFEDKSLKDRIGYNGWGIQFGGLWRPAHENYRIGFSFRPQTNGVPDQDISARTIGGLDPFRAVVSPARVSIGGSIALGVGRAYNITGKDEWAEPTGQRLPDGQEVYSPAMMKWIITAQLDIFGPVPNALSAPTYLEQGTGVPTLLAGNRASFEPRLAVEKEVVADRLRFRLGTYLEPPLLPFQLDPNSAGRTRPHLTFGGEVRIYKKLTFGLSFDFAYGYQNLSVALYTWK